MPDHVPPGCSIPAHYTHGWCGMCPYRDVHDEVAAWRAWVVQHMPVVAKAVGRSEER